MARLSVIIINLISGEYVKRIIKILIISIFLSFATFAQDYQFSGYLENLNSIWMMNENPNWALNQTVTNRINFSYFSKGFTFHTGLRNIWKFGNFITLMRGYSSYLIDDAGYFNLTKKITSGSSFLLYSNIDRLYLDYVYKEIEITLGRQRINLAENMVWNPNDIFNTYNYYDFTYVERPGSDAGKIEYYLNDVSSLSVAAKIDRNKKITAAGIVKLNSWDYDFQFFGGVMPDDYVSGFGWSGNIYGAGFSGEVTYFNAKEKKSAESDRLLLSMEWNYTFGSGLFIDGSLLFNDKGLTGNGGRSTAILREDMNVKYLSPSKVSLFVQTAYPITPLIRGTLSSIINPYDKSFYFGTMLKISLTNNIDFNIAGQFFSGEDETEFGQIGNFIFTQIKWNF